MNNRIQVNNNLNEVERLNDVGPGGAWHEYVIKLPEAGNIHKIEFQKGPRKDPEAIHGVLDSDLLEIVRDRLSCFQSGPYACRENACALTHIEEALMWMAKRSNDRAARNVLGTYNK